MAALGGAGASVTLKTAPSEQREIGEPTPQTPIRYDVTTRLLFKKNKNQISNSVEHFKKWTPAAKT
jgi:hypothetical protein